MDPFTMALIGGAVQGGSNLINTGVNIWSQKDQQAFNSAEAQKSREWQEYMSSTAYSRAVEDMKKAGLNPNLLAGGGGQASTSAGAVASGSASARGSFDFSQIFSSAISSMVAQNKISSRELISEMAHQSALDVAQFKAEAKALEQERDYINKKKFASHQKYGLHHKSYYYDD